jgi:hypothetical protein
MSESSQDYCTFHTAVKDEHGAMVDIMIWRRNTKNSKRALESLSPPQTSLEVTWDSTQVSTIRNQSLASDTTNIGCPQNNGGVSLANYEKLKSLINNFLLSRCSTQKHFASTLPCSLR